MGAGALLGYVWVSAAPGREPLHLWYGDALKDYFTTTQPGDYGLHGQVNHGIIGYVRKYWLEAQVLPCATDRRCGWFAHTKRPARTHDGKFLAMRSKLRCSTGRRASLALPCTDDGSLSSTGGRWFGEHVTQFGRGSGMLVGGWSSKLSNMSPELSPRRRWILPGRTALCFK